ncbi:hypothetical protein D9611_008642 [Ephemerocybe angulata]|uniref:Zn(2)-C6 fungal-type domain-containing protein n=1 Tax=Ephemerocybe angulata TaxID=980116 RepID=A0A8H5EV12_9AGAR|nr:hypothetical protein D9611_008642 [Tulosesus angulatus]
MPQVSRKDVNAQKAQDKESKRARGALSCAECRRLKLKCDKTVPCTSCKRRGCSAICPNGSLITGQGTRFVLADTEKLHTKISVMSDRIRQLEDALAVVQSTVTNEPHPLLARDLMKIKSSLELHSAVEEGDKEPTTKEEPEDGEETQYIDAFGTLAIRDDGAATFYGRSAGSESLLIGELPTSQSDMGTPRSVSISAQSSVSSPAGHYTSPEVANLAANFPLASTMYRPGIDIEYIVSTYLPPWQEAVRLYQLYLEQAPWFFGAITRRQIEDELLPMWYKEAPRPTNPATPGGLPANAASPTPSTASNGHGDRFAPSPSATKGNAHDLALLFMVYSYGSMTDMAMPPAPDNPESEHYHQLAKACLTIEPILERPPSVATVQTLSLMSIYEGICGKENSIESTWALFGIATKLAQSIGLHRDCARWKLSPGEVQKRRALFWELFITDCWQSLATGRLATFSLPFVDCELPFDPDQTMTDDGTPQPSFPYWKAKFGAECVSAVVQGTLTSRAPKYSIILELDRKVRDMELPLYAQGSPPEGVGLAQTMSHFMPTNYRELTLLYIHRCFFAHALSSNPQDPIKSQYAPSFLAGYRSACTIINSVKTQFTLFPAQIARFWVLWTHAFSASVMISSVITHSPKCKVAPAAMLELKTACDMFEAAALHGGRAGKFLPILKRLQTKAQQVYRDVHSGLPPKIPGDIFRPSGEDEKDELLIFSGKTTTVATKAAGSNTTRSAGSSPQSSNNGNMPASRAGSGSPGQAYTVTDNPSFANVHPSLMNELNMFDGHLRVQIQNARRAGGDLFGVPMVVDSAGPSTHGMRPPQVVTPVMSMSPVHDPGLLQEQQQHQQQFLQQMEHQRREELQRLELERQESARQQQLLAQRQQQEAARAHQEEQQRRQQQQQQQQKAAAEQQRQEEYHHQQMMQQRQMQGQAPPPPLPGSSSSHSSHSHQMIPGQSRQGSREYGTGMEHSGHRGPSSSSYARPMDTVESPYGPGPSHALHRIPTRSLSNINMQQAYQQQSGPPSSIPSSSPHTVYQQQHVSSHHHQHHPHHPSQSASGSESSGHHMYSMSPEPPSQSPLSHTHYSRQHAPSPASAYDVQRGMGVAPSSSAGVSPAGAVARNEDPNYYWSAAPTTAYGGQGHMGYSGQGQQPQSYHYTPEGALRGIAAEDPRLQETWQTYMNSVGSPRQFLSD